MIVSPNTLFHGLSESNVLRLVKDEIYSPSLWFLHKVIAVAISHICSSGIDDLEGVAKRTLLSRQSLT